MVPHPAAIGPACAVGFRDRHYTGELLGMHFAFGFSVGDAALPLARLATRITQARGDYGSTGCEALRRWESEGGRVV